jgi:glycosyltransferase involved in cell wall biosynthesis
MKICFLGIDNLPVLAPEHGGGTMGGESVQQTLIARALARRGYDVSMVTADCGQRDGASWDGISVRKAYRPHEGIPGLRFVHPRWTGIWSALRRADAELYYTSCAGMQVGLLALFCRRYRRRFVFRAASDTDCDASRLLVRYARDRWLYGFGLARADAILVQTEAQRRALARHYRLDARVAGMLVEPAQPDAPRTIDVLWVSNLRRLKRPDRVLDLATRLPYASIHMVGGPLPGEESLFEEMRSAVRTRRNITFHGRLPYHAAKLLYARARLLVNTSDIEGFPNAYLQAWINGVPVITLIDPDGVVAREGLGAAVNTAAHMAEAVAHFLSEHDALRAASERCRAYMARRYNEERILADYLETFQRIVGHDDGADIALAAGRARHA